MECRREFIEGKFTGALVCSCGLAVTYTFLAPRPDVRLNEMLDILHERFVEKSKLKKRCLHDVVNLLLNSIDDTQITDNPKEVLRCLAVAVNETGIEDFGEGECSCGRDDCPYK